MATVKEQIDAAISFLADRPAVFSAQDVADYADWEGHKTFLSIFPLDHSIEDALRIQCTIGTVLRLDESFSTTTLRLYLGVRSVRKWWVNSVLRWARTDLDYVTSTEIARAMSVAFDRRTWDAPPPNLLDVGQELAMVTDGCLPGTFVFPWTSLVRSNPQFREPLRTLCTYGMPIPWLDSSLDITIDQVMSPLEASIVRARLGIDTGRPPTLRSLADRHGLPERRIRQAENQAFSKLPAPEHLQWTGLSLNSAAARALSRLTEREAKVVQLRFGLLENGRRHTLEEIGRHFGVTRERIRQIEVKALRKFRALSSRRQLELGFAADFIRSGGSLLVPESSMTPWHTLLYEVLDLNISYVKILGLGIMTTNDLSKYCTYLSNDDNYQRPSTLLPFLSQADAMRLHSAEEEYWNNRVNKQWTRPRMLREALHSLGRAAHYQEIAEECNKLFPDSQTTTHSWHAALSLPGCETLGIVWIGRKGMYGLKEHGYSRPDTGLFESVARIVEEIYSKTQRPVSDEVVIIELGKQRRELNTGSVKMALSFNDKVESVGMGRYIPKASKHIAAIDAPHFNYDIAAAFEAFSDDEHTN